MTQPIKLLIITTGYPRFEGDIFAHFVQDIANEYKDEIKVTVLAPHERGLPYFRKEKHISVFRFPYFPFFECLAYGNGIPQNLKGISAKLQLPFFLISLFIFSLIFSFKHTLIHAQWGICGFIGLVIKNISGKKLMVTYHGSDLHGNGLFKKISLFVSRFADANICVSKEQMNQLNHHRCHLLSYPFQNRFHPVTPDQKLKLRSQFHLNADQFYFIYVGYLIPIKQVDHIIQTFLRLKNPLATLIIIGEGSEQNKLELLLKESNLGEQVKLLGKQPYHTIHKWFQIADVHLMSSKNEGRPNVLIQAMACALPSICTPVGGIPDLLDDQKTGFLAASESEDYLHHMDFLIKNPPLMIKMGKNARIKLHEMNLSSVDIAKRHLDLIHNLARK